MATEASLEIRTTKEQTSLSKTEQQLIELIYNKFNDRPTAFEPVAADILKFSLPNAHSLEITRPRRDGGRDATGKYRIGQGQGSIDVDFAMEAKCYALNNGVGVKEVSRLISRLSHRQFGVLVTTSYVAPRPMRIFVIVNT